MSMTLSSLSHKLSWCQAEYSLVCSSDSRWQENQDTSRTWQKEEQLEREARLWMEPWKREGRGLWRQVKNGTISNNLLLSSGPHSSHQQLRYQCAERALHCVWGRPSGIIKWKAGSWEALHSVRHTRNWLLRLFRLQFLSEEAELLKILALYLQILPYEGCISVNGCLVVNVLTRTMKRFADAICILMQILTPTLLRFACQIWKR